MSSRTKMRWYIYFILYFLYFFFFLTAWMSGLLSKYVHVFIILEVTLLYLCLLNSSFGDGNGTPLQYSCLENPMDGGAWWAAVHGVARSRTRLKQLHFHFSLSCIGEGNGNPLQCSCLENPRDGGAWWAAIYGVAQGRTRLKRQQQQQQQTLHWWFTMCTGHAVFWENFCQNFCFSQCHVISCFSLSPYSCLLNVCLYHVKSYTDLQKYLNCFVELLEGLEFWASKGICYALYFTLVLK